MGTIRRQGDSCEKLLCSFRSWVCDDLEVPGRGGGFQERDVCVITADFHCCMAETSTTL